MAVQVLSPRGNRSAESQLLLAPRPVRLGDAQLGLLTNGKPNVDNFFDEIRDALTRRYPSAPILRISKRDFDPDFEGDLAAPRSVLARLATETQGVIVGQGD